MRAFALLYFVAHIDKGELVGVEILVAKSELDLEQLVFDSWRNRNLEYGCWRNINRKINISFIKYSANFKI